jgi:hypothetical protein
MLQDLAYHDVELRKENYRYNIETQTNDLLEEMISNIPSVKRTNNVLNNIHTIITRFLQLRQMASTFDENSNVKGIIKVTSEDRPLAEYLSDFKKFATKVSHATNTSAIDFVFVMLSIN